MIVLENVLMAFVGCGVGVALGVVLAYAISRIGIPMPPPPNADLGYTAYIRISANALCSSFLIGFAATLLASLLPAIKMARMPIAEALRHGT